jgi:hypothetical protein
MASCDLEGTLCIEHYEPGETWCADEVAATAVVGEACPTDGVTGSCTEMPMGDDTSYTIAGAVAHYYGDFDGEGACEGTYTAAVEPEPEPDPVPTVDSCTIGVTGVCVEPTEPDNEGWCTGLPASYEASYSAEPCATDGLTGVCALPAGGDYTMPATGYYYSDAATDETACTDAGGAWSTVS